MFCLSFWSITTKLLNAGLYLITSVSLIGAARFGICWIFGRFNGRFIGIWFNGRLIRRIRVGWFHVDRLIVIAGVAALAHMDLAAVNEAVEIGAQILGDAGK